MLAYFAIFFCAISGLAAGPIWTIGAAAVALAALSFAEHHRLYQRGADLGLTEMVDTTLIGSLLNALLASSLAYGAGFAVRLLGI